MEDDSLIYGVSIRIMQCCMYGCSIWLIFIVCISGAVLIIVGGIVSAFCESYASLIIFRAIVGFGVGGISVPFDLLAEYTPASHRGQYLMYIEYFWTLGSVFVAASAWIFLSAYDWRVLTLVTAVPVSIGLTWSICYLPESPRWLLQQGRIEEAEKCIANIGVVNNFRMEPFKLNPKHTPAALDDSHGSSGSTDILNPSGNGHSEGKQVSIMDFLKRDQLGIYNCFACREAQAVFNKSLQ